jgi:hypothetical protein
MLSDSPQFLQADNGIYTLKAGGTTFFQILPNNHPIILHYITSPLEKALLK